jgi:hypothetical protein
MSETTRRQSSFLPFIEQATISKEQSAFVDGRKSITPPKKDKVTKPLSSTKKTLSTPAKPQGIAKLRTKLPKENLKHRSESPWGTYGFIDETVTPDETVMTVRKFVSAKIFALRTFPDDENFKVIEKQFKFVKHHNVLPAEEFFRHEQTAFIRSPRLDISFDRIIICRQYPSSKVLASMIGQVSGNHSGRISLTS